MSPHQYAFHSIKNKHDFRKVYLDMNKAFKICIVRAHVRTKPNG